MVLVCVIFVPEITEQVNFITFIDNVSEFSGFITSVLIGLLAITFTLKGRDPVTEGRAIRYNVSVLVLMLTGVLTFLTSSFSMLMPCLAKISLALLASLIVGLFLNVIPNFPKLSK